MYYTMRLNKQYFLVKGLNIDYPTLLMVLVAIQSFAESRQLEDFVLFVLWELALLPRVVIIFFWVFQFLLLVIQIGQLNLCLINLS